MSRAKGNRFERVVAAEFVQADGLDAVTAAIASSTGRVGHLDLGADVLTKRHAVECKHRQMLAPYLWTWLNHIRSHGRIPILCIKRDREEPLVVLRLSDYLDVLAGAK